MDSATVIGELDEAPLSSAVSPAAVSHSRIADFIALAKPRLNFLVVVTTGVGYFMAQRGVTDWGRLMHTLLGTALSAAGASALNQYLERDLDLKMARTHDRPLAAGRVGLLEGLLFAVLLCAAGLIELRLFVNTLTATLAAATLASYVLLYTPMKRRSTLCTIVGAVPGAIPIVMGWTAVRASISPEALALFGILFFWQMPHFLAIAILYRDDYATAGLQVLPVVDPDLRATARQIVLYATALIPISLLPTILHCAGGLYFAAALLLGMTFAGFGVMCAITRGRAEARQLFFASITYLPLLLIAMMVNKI
jgi:protoheme IX farnesyltransferase